MILIIILAGLTCFAYNAILLMRWGGEAAAHPAQLWPYVIFDAVTEEEGQFQTAHDVALFLWGRSPTRYHIKRYGCRVWWREGDVAEIERGLEG